MFLLNIYRRIRTTITNNFYKNHNLRFFGYIRQSFNDILDFKIVLLSNDPQLRISQNFLNKVVKDPRAQSVSDPIRRFYLYFQGFAFQMEIFLWVYLWKKKNSLNTQNRLLTSYHQ